MNHQAKENGKEDILEAVLFIGIMICTFFVLVCGTLLSKGMASSLSIGQETEFQETFVRGENMAQAGERFKEGTTLKEFDPAIPLKNAIMNYTYGSSGDGITDGLRSTLASSLKKHCYTLIKNLDSYAGDINGHFYDSEKSLSTFYENPFPYDLAEEGFVPKIGNVMLPGQTYYGIYYPEWNPRYDDVNYAEVLSILGMSTQTNGSLYGLHWGQLNYQDFMAFLQREECYKYMYELGLKWVPMYRGQKEETIQDENGDEKTIWVDFEASCEEIDTPHEKYPSPEECRTAPEDATYEGYACSFDYYYIEATVKPFGLRELFAMAFSHIDPVSAAYQYHEDFNRHTNLYMLNYQERVTRLYQRDLKVNLKKPDGSFIKTVDALGPSFLAQRSPLSPIYEEICTDGWLIENGLSGTGRSAWNYLDITYNDRWEGIVWESDPGGVLPPIINWGVVDGSKILDMYEYINQGDYPNVLRGQSNETIKKSGCLDCSIAMIIMYYKREHIPITEISKYVDSAGLLHTAKALEDYGLSMGSSVFGNFQQGVIEEINANRPVIIHISGHWKSALDGKVLHSSSNGHFLVGIGYDESGLYVYDPGKRSNYHIAYTDWSHVSDLYYRPVYP